jgi:HEPN domain-containing protein
MSGRDREREAGYWLELARGDLIAGQELATNAAVPPRCAAFFAHQAVETAFKAIVAGAGVEPPRTHDLVRLAHQTQALLTLTVPEDDLRSLTDAHIQGQYPDPAARPYTSDEVGALLEIASYVVSEAQRVIQG